MKTDEIRQEYYEELEDPATGKYTGYQQNLRPDTTEKKTPTCCACRIKTCIVAFIMINLIAVSGVTIYLFMKGGKCVPIRSINKNKKELTVNI